MENSELAVGLILCFADNLWNCISVGKRIRGICGRGVARLEFRQADVPLSLLLSDFH